jgi:hypothetical protein
VAEPTAPVQAAKRGRVSREIVETAYHDYSRRQGDQQSLDRLLERGGFSWAELVFHLYSELVTRHEDRGASRRPSFHDHIEVGRD